MFLGQGSNTQFLENYNWEGNFGFSITITNLTEKRQEGTANVSKST